MFDAVKDDFRAEREILEEACSSIQGWDNDFEMTHKIPTLCASIGVTMHFPDYLLTVPTKYPQP